jgi:(R,R)-butanediol dehydrogenase / meso-butanediol dehydrogenase / diacetyl reductase
MLAGLVTAQRTFELIDMPEPEAVASTAVVQVSKCGICGTDLHGFLGATPYNPAICGHEWVGTVSAVGAGVSNVSEGDRVVLASPPSCGRCSECLAGRPAYCPVAFLGMVGRDPLAPKHGGFAKAIAVDAARLVKVHAPISDDQAAVVEPAVVALHAVGRMLPHDGETVVVQGCGPIGLLTLQCAIARGASHVVAIEPAANRRELALELGAAEAIHPSEAMDRFGRQGADLVYECAGVPATIQQAVDIARRGGRVDLVGLASGAATISPHTWLIKEITVTAAIAHLHHEVAEVIDLIADGLVRTEPLHDRTVSLTELPAVIEELADDPSSAIKVLVDPTL